MDTAIVNQINPVIKETALKKGVNIIDLHTQFQTPAWFLDDSVHPNATGAQELARIVNKYITLEKPKIVQEKATLQVSGDNYGTRWYKDGKLIESDKATLAPTEKGKYRALVKVDSDSDSWIASNEIEVTDLNGGTTAISTNHRKAVQPKQRRPHRRVDVKGRAVSSW
mgnify:FL=1